MRPLARQSCADHPDRHGHAVCMTCHRTVCQECTTQWEGINYCRTCVARRATAAEQPARQRIRFTIMVIITAAGLAVIVRLAVMVSVFVVGSF